MTTQVSTTAPTTNSNSNDSCDGGSTTKQQRQTQWFVILAFSIIALSGLVTNFATTTVTTGSTTGTTGSSNITDQTKEVKWVVAFMSIVVAFSTIASMAHVCLLKDKFMNTNLETGMATLTFAFWTAAMPIIMNPQHNIAVGSYLNGGISNLNVYFFSWATFLLSFYNFFTCTHQSIHRSTTTMFNHMDDTHRCSHTLWAGLLVSSFVVMMASSRIHDDIQCSDNINVLMSSGVTDETYNAICDRTHYGIALGAVSTACTIIWLVSSMFWSKHGSSWGTKIEFGLVLFLWMAWTVGVVLLTFDQTKSPGRDLGNLYFFTWGSWTLNVIMFMMSFQYVMMSCYDDNKDTVKVDETMNKPAMEPVNEEEQITTDDDVMSA